MWKVETEDANNGDIILAVVKLNIQKMNKGFFSALQNNLND